jgi:hypothetical protein
MPAPPPRNADVLAGKATRYDVNTAAPSVSVKGANVIPNRERGKSSVVLSGQQYAGGVMVSLNGADRAPSKKVAPENASTSAREKSQLIHKRPPAAPPPSAHTLAPRTVGTQVCPQRTRLMHWTVTPSACAT